MTNYKQPFQITENIGNNVFCFDEQKNTKIHITSLITLDIEDFKSNTDKYLKIGSKTVFREKKNWKIVEYKWLHNFLEIKSDKQTIYIIDNHNHALYFRYKEYFEWNIKKWIELIHIDQHTDMNKLAHLSKQDLKTLDDVFEITNYHCNVWNFIQPAIQDWLISKVHQINTEYSLLNTWKDICTLNSKFSAILDIDLDFRDPKMGIEHYQETINITKKMIQKSRVVTIATSPYFLDQDLAINIIKNLFSN